MGEFLNSLLKGIFGNPSEEANWNMVNRAPEGGRLSHSLRNERLMNEIMMIAPRFSQNGGIYYDEEQLDWIMVPKYALPERWGERWSQLLIVPPATYPDTPPIGFYLNKKFQLKTGGYDPHATSQAYHGAPDLLKSGWHWYCVTVANGQGGWRASADYRQPDNLWTFLNLVRESLTNDF
jgi:hypothetical protein